MPCCLSVYISFMDVKSILLLMSESNMILWFCLKETQLVLNYISAKLAFPKEKKKNRASRRKEILSNESGPSQDESKCWNLAGLFSSFTRKLQQPCLESNFSPKICYVFSAHIFQSLFYFIYIKLLRYIFSTKTLKNCNPNRTSSILKLLDKFLNNNIMVTTEELPRKKFCDPCQSTESKT